MLEQPESDSRLTSELGGAFNHYTPNESELRDAKTNNEHIRRSSFQKSKDKAEESVKALADKAKAAVKGGKGGSKDSEAVV